MNNNQFRRLLDDQPRQQDATLAEAHDHKPRAPEQRSFSKLLPRNLKRSHNNDKSPLETTAKKFKTSTPEGSALGANYVDRAKARNDEEEKVDEKAEKIRDLEEQRKQGEITQEQFEAQRDEITSGDISNTHLVKGLDRRLLDRVRRGEDVLGLSTAPVEEQATLEEVDVDDELDKLGSSATQVVQRQRAEKQGVKAERPKTRDEIMAELKAKRKAAAEAQIAAQPKLDERWRRIDDKVKSKIIIDKKGREVLITVDEDGIVKKRVRKAAVPTPEEVPEVQIDPAKEVLGTDLVVHETKEEEQEVAADEPDSDDDIFAGVGKDYDPLGDEPSDDEEAAPKSQTTTAEPKTELSAPVKRNYFNERPAAQQEKVDHMAGIKNVIERAAKLSHKAEEQGTEEDATRRARHAEMLANRDRDLEDMDMGFGASRYEDGEDAEQGEKVKLSEWKGGKQDDNDGPEDRHREKKKRKPKKRKGDANSIADIMGVIERRKEK